MNAFHRIAGAVALCLASVASHAVTITTSQALRVDLGFTGTPAADVDLLSFDFRSLDFFGAGFAEDTTFRATLVFGDTTLGTAVTSDIAGGNYLQRQFNFTSAASLYTFGNPAIVDFAPILSGANGYFMITANADYSIEPSSNGIDRNFEVNLCTSQSADTCEGRNSPNYAYAVTYQVTDAVAAPVPEPATALLMLLGVPAIAFGARRLKAAR